jgi:hypothetical protein
MAASIVRPSVLITIGVVVVYAFGIDAEQQPTAQTFAGFRAATQALRQSFPISLAGADQIVTQANRIDNQVSRLQDVLRNRPVSQSFGRTLDQDLRALNRTNETRSPLLKAIATMTGVADDLTIKAGYLAEGGSPAADERVIAQTKRGMTNEPGYRVWYVVRGFADDPKEHLQFPLLSTPTEHGLAPGGYLLWSQRPEGGAEGARVKVDVGGRTEVDLPVPVQGR